MHSTTIQLPTTRFLTTAAPPRHLCWAFTVVLCLWGMLSPVKADSLDPTHIPADAQWVLHVDYEALSQSAVCKKLRKEKPIASQMAQDWMKKRYGIRPPKDLKSITMFSRDYREYTGTVIIQANYDRSRIEDVLNKAMNPRQAKWKHHTLHTVTLSKQKPSDDGPSGDEEMTVVMLDRDTILLASSVPNARQALKLLAGESPSLDGKQSPLLNDKVDNAWLYGAAINLSELRNHPVAMPVIAQHDQINWSFGEQSGGTLYEHADLTAQSEEVSKQMETVLNGIVAYERLWAEGSKPMIALLQNVKVMQKGKTTGFHWHGPSDQIVAAMDDLFDRMETWKPFLVKHKRRR